MHPTSQSEPFSDNHINSSRYITDGSAAIDHRPASRIGGSQPAVRLLHEFGKLRPCVFDAIEVRTESVAGIMRVNSEKDHEIR